MSNYFKKIPNFECVSKLPDAKISDYITVKNLFKRAILREDIFQNIAIFEKYQIRGDDRPDNVAEDFYKDPTLDWLVLICNNIVNFQTEWPLRQTDFDRFMLDKYGDYDTLYDGVHHYESHEVKTSEGIIIMPAGLIVDSSYRVTYYDSNLGRKITDSNVAEPVTNYEYEVQLEDNKRNIFLLKPRYVGLVKDDFDDIMTYKKGSTQYVSETLKRGDNIRLYT